MTTLLDTRVRSLRGEAAQARLLAAPAAHPASLLDESWRDFIFAEVWERPELALRARYLIAMTGAANAGDQPATDAYVRGALKTAELSVSELREAALHAAVYCGWSTGGRIDRAITTICEALGIACDDVPPIRAGSWDPADRIVEGVANAEKVMTFPGPLPQNGFLRGGHRQFRVREMWTRPGLDEVSRRWITLVGVADSASDNPIRSHVYAAMKSGNATAAEMFEFVLQYAVHAGWPRASVVQTALFSQGERVAKSLPFEP